MDFCSGAYFYVSDALLNCDIGFQYHGMLCTGFLVEMSVT